MSIEVIKQMVGVLASITGEPDRNLQQRPERYAKAREAIEAGRQAIAEAEKQERGEPVAEISRDGVLGVDFIDIERALKLPNGAKLYTAPQQYKPLTDEQKSAALTILAGFCANPAVFAPNSQFGWGLVNCSDKQLCEYALSLSNELDRAIEAAHGMRGNA